MLAIAPSSLAPRLAPPLLPSSSHSLARDRAAGGDYISIDSQWERKEGRKERSELAAGRTNAREKRKQYPLPRRRKGKEGYIKYARTRTLLGPEEKFSYGRLQGSAMHE